MTQLFTDPHLGSSEDRLFRHCWGPPTVTLVSSVPFGQQGFAEFNHHFHGVSRADQNCPGCLAFDLLTGTGMVSTAQPYTCSKSLQKPADLLWQRGPCTSNMEPAGEKVQRLCSCCLRALPCALLTRRRKHLAECLKNATSGLSG